MITKENIPLLQILDAMRTIKLILDASLETSSNRLFAILRDLPQDRKTTLVRLGFKYQPATRALLGALLDELNETALTDTLYKTLNPITKYKFTGVNKVISTTTKWNII